MHYLRIFWDDPDDPEGNVQHIDEHGLSVDEVELVLGNPRSEGISRRTSRPCAWGYTPDGRYIIVVYEWVDNDSIRVITAYEVSEPSS